MQVRKVNPEVRGEVAESLILARSVSPQHIRPQNNILHADIVPKGDVNSKKILDPCHLPSYSNCMAKRSAPDVGRPNPLALYAKDAPAEAMRFMAGVALAKGLNQERLAIRYAQATERRVNGANVARHFRASAPDLATVDSYAKALELPPGSADLARGIVPENEREVWETRLQEWLLFNAAMFKNGTRKAVADALSRLGEDAATRALAAFALGWTFDVFVTAPKHGESSGNAFQRLAAALSPVLDLRALLVPRTAHDQALLDAYYAFRIHFDDAQSRELTYMLKCALTFAGYETDAMARVFEHESAGSHGVTALRAARLETDGRGVA